MSYTRLKFEAEFIQEHTDKVKQISLMQQILR